MTHFSKASVADSGCRRTSTQLARLALIAPMAPIVLAFAGLLAGSGVASANVYQYDDAVTTTIPNPAGDNTGNCSAGVHIDRTFIVPAADSFNVAHIGLGLNVSHTERSDLRVELFRPGAVAPFVVIAGNTGNGESNDNYDILLSSNSDAGAPGTAPLNDADADPVAAPFFNRLVTVATMDFYTGNSVGTWTLRICDVDSAGATGTYNRSRLILTDATVAGSVCTGTRLTYNWGANGNGVAFANTTVGGVTINQASATNFAGGLNAGTNWNFRTDTDSLGGHAGFYSLYMDASATGGGADDSETLGQEVVFSFLVAGTPYSVQDLEFQTLDSDQATGDFEDILRIEAAAVGGGHARYSRTPLSGTPVFQDAGDTIEGDSACDNGSNCASEDYKFDRALSSVTIGYYAGDDMPLEAGDQVVGISDFQFCAFDLGDAPNTYGTLVASNGARHVLGSRELWLGTNRPDGESDGQPGGGVATADDVAAVGGIDDEDGVTTFPACLNNGTYSVTVSASDVRTSGADGVIRGYIDWNRNGNFTDANEISDPTTVTRTNADPSTYTVTWSSVPANCGGTASTFARFRYSTSAAAVASPLGLAPDGEVEDYQISDSTLPVTIARIETVPNGNALTVRFTTATESGNAGFRIWGTSLQGKAMLLATIRSQGSDSFVPQSYEATVGSAGITAIQIEDVSVFGQNRMHGPFAVGSSFGEAPAAANIDWAAVKSEAGIVSDLDRVVAAESPGGAAAAGLAGLPMSPSPSARGLLLVRNEGIHRVTYEELLAAGINLSGVQPARIAIVDNGVGVPRYVEASGPTFGPGGYIEFVARPQLTLASPVDALVLTVDAGRAIAAKGMLTTGAGSPAVTPATDVHRPDNIYSYSSPNGDPWMDARVLSWGAPGVASRTFDLPDLAAGSVSLRVRVWGWGDFDGAAPDHHVVVKVNGTEVGQQRFDGLTTWEPVLDVTGLVNESGNTLEIDVPGDTGYSFDNIAFEGFDVTYSRGTLALGDRFQGTVQAPGAFAIGGFGDGQPVSIWKVSGATAARGQQLPIGDTVSANGGAGQVYAAAQGALYHPGISAGVPAAKLSSSAQYLIVTHPAFASSIGDLVALEESRGFTTEVVTVDRIFAAYSDYVSSAAALKSFLSASLAQGNLRYVLLVGADTTDPYNHLGTGSVSYVPTDYRNFVQYVTFSPTDESLVDRQNDGLGDVPIGRLPVRTPAELDAVVAKLVAWEQAIGTGQPSALLAAGLSDGSRALATVNESYAASLSGWNTVLAQVDDSNTATVRQQVLDAINAGAHLVSYVGHSSMGQWDFTPILKWQDAATLTNAGLPNLFTSWGCWNSYYVEPTIESLSARLLRQPDAGAAGVIGATTLTTESSHRQLGNLFFARLNAGATTVGQAFHGAKQDLQLQGGAADAIYGMTLLGDPAMSLPQP